MANLSPVNIVLSCVFSLGMLFFAIAFLIDWVKSRQAIKKYLAYGLAFGAAIVGVDILTVAITPAAWTPTTLVLLCVEPIVLIRIVGFTMLGMYYAAVLGYPSFPLLLPRFRLPTTAQPEAPTAPVANAPLPPETNAMASDVETPSAFPPPTENDAPIIPGAGPDLAPEESPPPPASGAPAAPPNPPATDVLLPINWPAYALHVVGVSALTILYSSGLFLLTSPQLSALVQQSVGTSPLAAQNVITPQSILVMLEVAVAEEIVFRLGIQNFLAKYLKVQNNSYWLAILLTSALWTIGHTGVLEPEWVKLAQIFPVGLMLGWLYKKYGIESTMLVHGLFNVVLLSLAGYLIK